ncbi:MAG: 5'-nucleotidase C-terminal domain-containing protein [Polyangiales bacterium]
MTLDPARDHVLRDAINLAQSIEGDARPDLVVVQELDEGVLSVDTARASVPVVAARPDSVIVAEPGGARVARRANTGTAPEAVATFVSSTRDWLCQTYSRPLPGGRLTQEVSREQFANLLLDVVRERTEAEVAVINRAAVRAPPGLFPVTGGLTPLTVSAAIPFDDTVQVTTIRGSVLRAFVTASRASTFYVRGVTVDGSNVRVNGRALEDTQEYHLATTGFIAGLGANGIAASGVDFDTYGTQSLQDSLLGWLGTARTGNILDAPVDPAENTRWYLRLTVDGTFTSVNIRNLAQDTYNDTQLTRAEATNLKLDAQFFASADHPRFGFQNLLRVEYGLGRNQPIGGADTGFVETRDLISNRANITWRVFRGERRWFQPLPDAEGYIESEFDPPGNGGRDFHHLQLRPTIGARFDLTDRLYFRLGAGLDWEVFEPDSVVKGVVVTRLELNPGRLFSIGDRVVEGRFFADLSFRNPWDDMNMFIRAGAQLSIPLFRPLALTLGYEIFGRAFNDLPFAIAGDATVGLKVTLDRSIQTF